MTEDPYDRFAADYHWLFPDDVLSGAAFVPHYGDVLDRLSPGAAVLDCACGIGSDAIALARAGFRVWASDGSAGMVEHARQRILEAGVDVPVSVCPWDSLPEAFDRRFAAVFCLGNSLAHAAGPEAMARSLTGMHAVLETGGLLVLSSRDWEVLRARRPRIVVADRVIERDGVRCTSLYVWDWPERWDGPHCAEIVFVLEREGTLASRHYEIAFVPFRRAELVERVRAAGFEDVRIDDQAGDRYRLCARRG